MLLADLGPPSADGSPAQDKPPDSGLGLYIKTHQAQGHSRTPPTSELHHDLMKKGNLLSTQLHLDVGKKECKNKSPHIDHHIKTHLVQGHIRALPTSELHHDAKKKVTLQSPQFYPYQMHRMNADSAATRLLADLGPPSADDCPAQEYPLSALPNPPRPHNTVLYG